MAAHVIGAGDQPVGARRHCPFHAVDPALRVLVDPALVAAVLGRVDRHDQRATEAVGEVVAGYEDKPVVAMDDVKVVAVTKLDAGRQHVGVHVLNPSDKFAKITGAARFRYAVNDYAGDLFLSQKLTVAAREHVNVNALHYELLSELAHMARQAALDDGRVLPGKNQNSGHGSSSGARLSVGARLRSAASPKGTEDSSALKLSRWPPKRSSGYGPARSSVSRKAQSLACSANNSRAARGGRVGPAASARSSASRARPVIAATFGDDQVRSEFALPQLVARSRPIGQGSASTCSSASSSGASSTPRCWQASTKAARKVGPSCHQRPKSSVSKASVQSPPSATRSAQRSAK